MEAAEKIKVRLSDERASLSALDHGSMGGLKEDIDVSEFDLDINQVPRKLLYEIMDSRVDEIFNLVALEIKKANLVGKLPAGIVLTGGAGLTSGIERVAKSVLKMPVRVGYPKGVTGLIDEIEGPAFSAVVGSIIYGSKLVRSGPMLSFESQRGNIRSVFSKLIDKAKSFLP